jgi:hypothetical protein
MRDRVIFAIWLVGYVAAATIAIRGLAYPFVDRDYSSFWIAGQLARTGHAAAAYDLEALRAAATQSLRTTVKVTFPYPPHSLLIFAPLSAIPYKLSFWVWQVFSAALFYVAARPFLPIGFPKPLVLLTPAALLSVSFGQVGLFYGALWFFAFGGSSIAAAMLTFKPHLGFLVAVEVFRRRAILATVVAAALIILLSVLVFGLDAWRASLFGAATKQLQLLASGAMPKWSTQMTTPLFAYGVAGWAFFAVAAIILVSRNFNVFSAATATFLIAPYGLHYDMTVASLGFGVLLFSRWNQMRPWHRAACAFAFLTPAIVAAGSWLVPPLLLAGLYVQCLHSEALRNGEEPAEN